MDIATPASTPKPGVGAQQGQPHHDTSAQQQNKIRAFEPFLDHHNRPHFLSLDCTTKRGRKVKQKFKSPHRFELHPIC